MKRGFTLIEVLLALTIGIVIVSTAVSLYLAFMREYAAIQEKQRFNNECMRVHQDFIRQVVDERQAFDAIRLPETMSSLNIQTESVGGRTLVHIQLTDRNRATAETYASSLTLTLR